MGAGRENQGGIYTSLAVGENSFGTQRVNREAAKISALSSGKINKYKYLVGEEILPSDQKQII